MSYGMQIYQPTPAETRMAVHTHTISPGVCPSVSRAEYRIFFSNKQPIKYFPYKPAEPDFQCQLVCDASSEADFHCQSVCDTSSEVDFHCQSVCDASSQVN
jgi:hypothetical protein